MRWGRGTRRATVPYVILVVGLGLTAASAWNTAATASFEDRLRFESGARAVRSAIVSRIDAYLAMLLGGAGLFAASDEVDFEEFHAYVSRISLADRYPGIQGIGFSRLVRPGEQDEVLARARARLPSFRFWPGQAADHLHAIVFLEPQDAANVRALGYDMWSEEVRRAAMAQARDSGEPAATRRVRLVQEEAVPGEDQAGFLIYVPVYRGGDVPATLEARRDQLLGFVYSPFRADDLLAGVLGVAQGMSPALDVFDGAPEEGQLLHRSHAPGAGRGFEFTEILDVAGRRWTLVFRSSPADAAPGGHTVTALVLGGGVVLSLLLFAVTRTQIRARESAERTAEDLRRSEEALRAANQAKDNFLATISHELRTPLNAIVGWAHMLSRGDLPPDRQAHALSVIARNAAAQTRLVEDLLDASKAAAERLRLELVTVEAAAAVMGALESIRPAADDKRLYLHADVPRRLGTVRGDPARLQQILGNLLSNAVKFTPPGGSVTVAARAVGAEVVIAVSDTGVGIAPEFLPHVFERFRQADSSTTRSHAGVGLGLTIVRDLVELHGGTVTAASDGVGRGATFTVRLPLAP
jgi:signal transduction histidine kinase